jgi:hypothetical protein
MRIGPSVVLLSLVLAAGCDAIPDESRPEEGDMIASKAYEVPGREVLWEVVVAELSKAGYELDVNASDEATGAFETQWIASLAPHRYSGTRKKILGRIVECEGRPGCWRVLATTWVEKNAEIKAPMDPARAIWQNDDADDAQTETLFYKVGLHF